MITIRYSAFILALICVLALNFVPLSVASAVLAAMFFLFYLIFCWTLRSATRKASS